MRWSACSSAIIIVKLGLVALGQQSLQSIAGPFPRFTQTQGQLDTDGFPTSGAKLCVLGSGGGCFQMPSEAINGNVTFEFGLDPRSERLPLPGGGSWVFFSGTFSAGGSGSLERLAVLCFEPSSGGGKIINLLPFVGATNVSERAMWNVASASQYPILVHADFIWGKDEPHFDPHFYTVEAWKFNPKVLRYVKVFSYDTKTKYGGGDSEPVHVLTPERSEILRRLQPNYLQPN